MFAASGEVLSVVVYCGTVSDQMLEGSILVESVVEMAGCADGITFPIPGRPPMRFVSGVWPACSRGLLFQIDADLCWIGADGTEFLIISGLVFAIGGTLVCDDNGAPGWLCHIGSMLLLLKVLSFRPEYDSISVSEFSSSANVG